MLRPCFVSRKCEIAVILRTCYGAAAAAASVESVHVN